MNRKRPSQHEVEKTRKVADETYWKQHTHASVDPQQHETMTLGAVPRQDAWNKVPEPKMIEKKLEKT